MCSQLRQLPEKVCQFQANHSKQFFALPLSSIISSFHAHGDFLFMKTNASFQKRQGQANINQIPGRLTRVYSFSYHTIPNSCRPQAATDQRKRVCYFVFLLKKLLHTRLLSVLLFPVTISFLHSSSCQKSWCHLALSFCHTTHSIHQQILLTLPSKQIQNSTISHPYRHPTLVIPTSSKSHYLSPGFL